MPKYHDYPLDDCLKVAVPLIEGGAFVYQKFTCRQCGSRQTMEHPNMFYRSGKCEACGFITDIEKFGCNYLVHKIVETRR